MDSALDAARDPTKRSDMSEDEKKLLVHELSKDPDSAYEVMKEWDREEIVEAYQAELGKKARYKMFPNDEIIHRLLKTLSERNEAATTSQRNSERQRKNVTPTHFNASGSTSRTKGTGTSLCKNVACQGLLRREDLFCKRCSCCICRRYDENKDPSLWLTCTSNPPFAEESCGFSSHLECSFKNENSGLKEDKPSNELDGCFYCVYCGKTNRSLECLQKQLVIVKETRSVDVLRYRLVLAQKLLKGTEMYKTLSEPVEEAVKSLETELRGPLADLPSAMCRGNVSRLESAPRVKDLCSSALISLQEILRAERALPFRMPGPTMIRFDDVHATSLSLILASEGEPSSPGNIIHHSVWHRKVSEKDYADNTTCELVPPNTSFLVSGLTPATEYCFKVVSFSGSEQTSVEESKVSTKTSQEEEEEEEAALLNSLSRKEEETVPKKVANNGKKSSSCGFGLGDFVKILRQLESSGHLEKSFREEFLTWYSFNASADDKEVVKGYVDGFENDSKSLASQLIHSFTNRIS